MSASRTRGEIEADYAARNYAKSADDYIASDCLNRPTAGRTDCIRQAIEASREDQRSERDLQAQETMARWTAVMGLVAAIGLGVSVVGVVLIYTTFQATHRTAEIAQRQFDLQLRAERGQATIHKAYANASAFAEREMRIDVFNTGRTPITVKRIVSGRRKNFAEWNFREAERFESISPYYCRPEKSVSVCAYPLNSDVLPMNFVVLGTIYYDTLGLKDCECHFAFAAFRSADATAWNFTRFEVSENIPDDT